MTEIKETLQDALDWFYENTEPENLVETEEYWLSRRRHAAVLQKLIDRGSPKCATIEADGIYYRCPECDNFMTANDERINNGMYCEVCGQYVKNRIEK